MKVSLRGLFANVVSCLPRRERNYYEFCLQELQEHIVGLVRGEYTIDEFAEHYCIDKNHERVG